MGGMAAQIPIKNDAKANDAAMEKVRQDKLREVKAGHDGCVARSETATDGCSTWVAHPALAKIALEIFNEHMVGPNQYHVRREEVNVSALDLLNTNVEGTISEGGIRANVSAALSYCSACVAKERGSEEADGAAGCRA